MRYHLIVTTLAVGLSPSIGFAQEPTIGGVVDGIVRAPGAVIGGTVGMAAEPPVEVRTYVVQRRIPSVDIEDEVIIGEPLPPTVRLRTIPRYNAYRYAIVNDQRVIVEPRTRRVIQIVE